jgi:hypothetical protein
VPGAAVGVVVRAEEDEVAPDVGDVAVGVQGVGSSHGLGSLAGERRFEHELAEGGVAHARADEVRGATDDDPDLAALVSVEELSGHDGAGPALHARRVVRGGLAERPRARAVHVEVLEDDELGARRLRGVEDRALKRRELFRPAVVVGCVEAEVHGVGVGGHGAGELRVGGVTTDRLHAGDRRRAAPVHHANPGAPVDEGSGDGATGGSGAEHDMRSAGHDCTALAGMNQPMMMLCRKTEAIAP